MVRIRRFTINEFDAATEEYARLEKKFRKDDLHDVVLVSASSVKALKQGYPNYFADTAAFSAYLNRALKENKPL